MFKDFVIQNLGPKFCARKQPASLGSLEFLLIFWISGSHVNNIISSKSKWQLKQIKMHEIIWPVCISNINDVMQILARPSLNHSSTMPSSVFGKAETVYVTESSTSKPKSVQNHKNRNRQPWNGTENSNLISIIKTIMKVCAIITITNILAAKERLRIIRWLPMEVQ